MSDEPNKIIYSMIGVSKFYDQKPVLKDISLSYFYGAKIGVLGLNGSGKSSLLRILAGVDPEFNGETHLSPGKSVGLVEQEPELDDTKTVREIVEEGAGEAVELLAEFNRISESLAEPMEDDEMMALIERQGEVQEKLDDTDAWDLDSRLEMAMDALRCPDGDQPVDILSGGERRRVALCRLLLQKPDILLLDEPTNHLDAETVAWLEQHLQRYEGTVIAVTHDRYFLDNVAGWILELDRGHGIPWKGNYSSWLDQKQKRLRQEEKTETERQKTLERELEWIRMSPKGRHAKSKARINSYEALLAQESEKRSKDLEIYIPPGPRLGDVVIEADKVTKAYHPVPHDHGPGGAGFRGDPDRRDGEARVRRPEPGCPRPGPDHLGVHIRGQGPDPPRQSGSQFPRLRGPVQLLRHGPAEEGRDPLRRGTQPHPPGPDAEGRSERAPPRRAHE